MEAIMGKNGNRWFFLTLGILGIWAAAGMAWTAPPSAPGSKESGKTGSPKSLLVHLETDPAKDDAPICVAYNAVAVALREGRRVRVLVDAGAVNAYVKSRWRFWSDEPVFSGYRLPKRMKEVLAPALALVPEDLPETYGSYAVWLNDQGAEFYVNAFMLVVAGHSETPGDLSRFSAKFMKPVSLLGMQRLREEADFYWVY